MIGVVPELVGKSYVIHKLADSDSLISFTSQLYLAFVSHSEVRYTW